jgi:F-box-like
MDQQGLRWANHLPSEILSLIVSKCITSAAQYVSISRVCREWRRSLTNYSPLPPLPSAQLPFLLIPRHEFGPDLPLGYIYPLSFTHPYRQPATFSLPHLERTDGCICVGSSHGWLITLGRDSSISLLNPVTGDSIHLPLLSSIDNRILYFDHSSYPEYHLRQKGTYNSQASMIHRAVLSSDPIKDPGFTVLLFFSGLTDSCFTCNKDSVTWHQHLHEPFLVEDVIFFNGVFIAIDLSINLVVFDFSNFKTGLVMKQQKPQLGLSPKEAFLVEEAGDLLLVVKRVTINWLRMSRKSIKVFIVVMPEKDGDGDPNVRALEVAWLSQRTLFVGHGCSVCVPVQPSPWMAEGKVYFLDVYPKLSKDDVGRDIVLHNAGVHGVNVSSKVMRKVFVVDHRRFAPLWTHLRFYWVTPNLNRK